MVSFFAFSNSGNRKVPKACWLELCCFADSGPSVALLLVAPDSGQMQHGALEITGFLAQRDSLEPLSL